MRDPAEHGAAQVVTFPVEVDISTAPYAATWLLETLEGHPRVVIADLSRTKFCDTSGIRLLQLASKRIAEQGAKLRIAIPSHQVRRTMHLADVDNVLRLYPDLASALTGEPAAVAQQHAGADAEAAEPTLALVPPPRLAH